MGPVWILHVVEKALVHVLHDLHTPKEKAHAEHMGFFMDQTWMDLHLVFLTQTLAQSCGANLSTMVFT